MGLSGRQLPRARRAEARPMEPAEYLGGCYPEPRTWISLYYLLDYFSEQDKGPVEIPEALLTLAATGEALVPDLLDALLADGTCRSACDR